LVLQKEEMVSGHPRELISDLSLLFTYVSFQEFKVTGENLVFVVYSTFFAEK